MKLSRAFVFAAAVLAAPARLTEIGLFCDSDDTKTASVAYVADVRMARR